MDNSGAHQFGGAWTTAKLEVLAKYLMAYTTALKDKPSRAHPFRKAYIDAFAGSGYRQVRREGKEDTPTQTSLLPDLAEQEPQDLLEGSARLALRTEPSFDRYVFIDRSPFRCAQLEALKIEFPHLAQNIQIRNGDANTEVQTMCKMDWRAHRAVLFLDPYGMEVEWKTIEAIAATKAIDLWLLFPLGIGVNRLLTRSGRIPEAWRQKLNLLLGTEEWYDEFYKVETTPTLFGNDTTHIIKAKMDTIGRYFDKVGYPFDSGDHNILWLAIGGPRKGLPIAPRFQACDGHGACVILDRPETQPRGPIACRPASGAPGCILGAVCWRPWIDQTTTPRGYLSQVDTPFSTIASRRSSRELRSNPGCCETQQITRSTSFASRSVTRMARTSRYALRSIY